MKLKDMHESLDRELIVPEYATLCLNIEESSQLRLLLSLHLVLKRSHLLLIY